MFVDLQSPVALGRYRNHTFTGREKAAAVVVVVGGGEPDSLSTTLITRNLFSEIPVLVNYVSLAVSFTDLKTQKQKNRPFYGKERKVMKLEF